MPQFPSRRIHTIVKAEPIHSSSNLDAQEMYIIVCINCCFFMLLTNSLQNVDFCLNAIILSFSVACKSSLILTLTWGASVCRKICVKSCLLFGVPNFWFSFILKQILIIGCLSFEIQCSCIWTCRTEDLKIIWYDDIWPCNDLITS